MESGARRRRRMPRPRLRSPLRPRRLLRPAAAVAVSLALLPSCEPGAVVVRGTGAPVQERRAFRHAERLVVEGGLDVTVRVVGNGEGPLPRFSSGGESILWIEAPEDIVHLVEHVVSGDQLTLRTRDGVRLDPVPSVELTVRRLVELTALGSGEIDLEVGDEENEGGPPMAERLSIVARGSVDMRALGTVGALEVTQEGSGDLRLERLRAAQLRHTSRGAGDTWVHVDGPVEVELLGSCDLHIAGDAVVERIETHGSGEVHRVEIRPTRASGDARSPR